MVKAMMRYFVVGQTPSGLPRKACLFTALITAALGFADNAMADGAMVSTVKCSAWRAADKPNDRIELRTCKKTIANPKPDEPDDDGDADDTDAGDEEETVVTVEMRSGYDKPRKIRYELQGADGTAETAETTIKAGVNHLGTCRKCNDGGEIEKWRILDGAKSDGDAQNKNGKAGDALQRVKGNMHIEVLARDLRLTASDTERLKRIGARYFKATRKRLIVTGGTRTPKRQAQLMYNKLDHGDDIVALYENKAAATEIRNAYRDGTAKKLSRKRLIRTLAETIQAQISRGVYVSKHLKSGAVDVRSWGLSAKQEEALREAVKQESGVSLLDERNSAEPHFHLSL